MKRQQLTTDEAAAAFKLVPIPPPIERPASRGDRIAKASGVYMQFSNRGRFLSTSSMAEESFDQESALDSSRSPSPRGMSPPYTRAHFASPRTPTLPRVRACAAP